MPVFGTKLKFSAPQQFRLVTKLHSPSSPGNRHGRVGEDVAILTPHRPGRADFPLPVLHGRASLTAACDAIRDSSVEKVAQAPRFSLASLAIRCRFVNRFARPKVLSRVSRQRLSPRDAPLSSIGSRRARFPDVGGTTRALRLPPHVSPGRLLGSLPGPTRSSLRFVLAVAGAPGRPEVPPRARIIGQPAIPIAGGLRVDMSGISQVPRRSILCLCPGPRPRPDRRALANGGLAGAAPASTNTKAPA